MYNEEEQDMDLRLRLYQAHIQTLLSTELHVSSSLPLTSPCTPHHVARWIRADRREIAPSTVVNKPVHSA